MGNSKLGADRLAPKDLEILQYIKKHGETDIDTLKRALKHVASVELRVKDLSTPQYSSPDGSPAKRRPVPNTSYLQRVGTEPVKYRLTELGEIAVEDNADRRKQRTRLFSWENIWIPLTLTAITSLAAGALKLWRPQILKWLASILPKIFP